MRNWEKPMAVVDAFVANEFVSACGDSGVVYKFNCNAGKMGHDYAAKDRYGNIAKISGHYIDGGFGWNHWSFTPCGEKHEAESDSEFLTGYHIDDLSTRKDENIQVIIWTNNGTDIHCTTNLNKSTWETAKS